MFVVIVSSGISSCPTLPVSSDGVGDLGMDVKCLVDNTCKQGSGRGWDDLEGITAVLLVKLGEGFCVVNNKDLRILNELKAFVYCSAESTDLGTGSGPRRIDARVAANGDGVKVTWSVGRSIV
jgi:hypothetical protein